MKPFRAFSALILCMFISLLLVPGSGMIVHENANASPTTLTTASSRDTPATNGATVVDLAFGQTYDSFDITGDGSFDTFCIEAIGPGTAASNSTVTVSINGSKALDVSAFTPSSDYCEAKLITLANKSPFLYFHCSTINGYYSGGWVYQYSGSSLKEIIATKDLVAEHVSSSRKHETLRSVNGNSLTFSVGSMGTENPSEFVYVYRNGTLVRDRSGAWGTCQWSIDASGVLTIGEGTGVNVATSSNVPWAYYKRSITAVKTEGTVVLPSASCYLFSECKSLTTADISGFYPAVGTTISGLFSNCSSLKTVYVGDAWAGYAAEGGGVFSGCTSLIGGRGTAYDSAHVDAAYARVDEEYSPGYFTHVSDKLETVEATFSTDSGDVAISFDWSPSLLVNPPYSKDASSFDRKIALAGLILSGQAEQGQQSAANAFVQLGLADEASSVYSHDYTGLGVGNSIACVSYKRRGTTYKIVTVDIQGTRPFENLAPADIYTFGFESTATAILGNMKSDIGITDVSDYRYRYFITGHSLGGAAASILAKKLLDEGCSRDQIVAYTFASPCTCGITGGSNGCENIKNIINKRDTVPRLQNVGTFDWRRNGSDFYFSSNSAESKAAYYDLVGHTMPSNGFDITGIYLEEHVVQTYMSYLLAAEGTYKVSKTAAENTRFIAVHCPVSVDILNPAGRIALSAPDGVAGSGKTADGIQLVSDGDAKYILLPEACGDFVVRLTGTGAGTMSCSVQGDVDGNYNLIEPATYENVSLAAGKTFQLLPEAGGVASDASLFVVDASSGEKIAKVSRDGGERSIPNLAESSITIHGTALAYTGKEHKPAVTVKLGSAKLTEGVDYTVTYKNNVNAGMATAVVTGKGDYTGTAKTTFQISKAKNTMTAKAKTKKLNAKNLAKRKAVVKKLVTVEKAKGKVAYKKASKAKKLKKFKVNSMTGAITVPKNTKKGTYKLKVKVTAKGDVNYKSGSKTVTVQINVK